MGYSPDIRYSPEYRWREPPCVIAAPRRNVLTHYRRVTSSLFGELSLRVFHWKPPTTRPIRVGMRYFFHIVDRYGLFPDKTGVEHADQGSAVRHARNIAAELAKAGEFFRSSIVFVSRDGATNQ